MVNLAVDINHDSLIQLSPGDEVVNCITGQRVVYYQGRISYLIPTGGSRVESDLKIDTVNVVTELINGIFLPGIWIRVGKVSDLSKK